MIPVQNIYYMLSYAFQVLNEQGYKDIATEQFNNAAELCAAILCRGISVQLKRGLGREYITETEPLSSVRGKVDITESIKTRSIMKRQLVCTYDEFSVNSTLNQIIKTTVDQLLRFDNVSKSRKKELRKLMVYFSEVDVIDYHTINWNMQYNRNNQTYRMLISVCYLVLKGLLQTNSNGTTRLMDFIDEQRMCRLYEKFILEYYRREFPQLCANPDQIPWQLDDDVNDMLPIMQTDITLSNGIRTLIIDAKYYGSMTQSKFDAHTLHSNNVYQIFTYVKNKEAEMLGRPHEVSGLLLYAKTDETIVPNNSYKMSGNKISVKALDLNCSFDEIEKQLYKIAKEHFSDVADTHFFLTGRGSKAVGIRGEDNKFIVLAGSQISTMDASETCPEAYIKLREQYQPIIQDSILKEDIIFDSPTSAAGFVLLMHRSGNFFWRTKDGINLGDFKKKY